MKTANALNDLRPKIRTVDDLSFTGRDANGRFLWWSVEPPKTNYWHCHELLGRAHAFELLDYLQDADADDEFREYAFGCVATEIARQAWKIPNDGLYRGFFSVVSEYLATGKVSR